MDKKDGLETRSLTTNADALAIIKDIQKKIKKANKINYKKNGDTN